LLDRLFLAGVNGARIPRLLHSVLTLLCQGDGHDHEPLPRHLLARELVDIVPADAVREGFEALKLGNARAYDTVVEAAHSLNLLDGPAPAHAKISLLEQIARKCKLGRLSEFQSTPANAFNTRIKIDKVLDA